MPTFRQGDVVRVPFPYTDKETRQHRPALVVSRSAVGESRELIWIVMITSAANRGWPGDVSLADDFRSVGLPVPSVIRPSKIATIESRDAERLGTLPGELWQGVEATLRGHLGFD
jgi:mRNA interferase MazF